MRGLGRIEIGRETEGGGAVSLDLATLLPSRLLLQATSGGGKSWALRRILEQSHGMLQQIVVDPEGEFPSLREKLDYVLVGRGGDIAADARYAEMLAHRLLDLGVNAVCDLYEMRARERTHFVRLFLDGLINAPRRLWHPVLVVVDEAHVYCPEKGDAESTDAVADLCTRGRKRGFCAVLATQRLSNLNKQAAAQCFNVMIGPTSLDIDRKRAVEALGLSGADQRRVGSLLMTREPGEFYCVGRAMSKTLTLVKVGEVLTHHPEIARGRSRAPATPPPPERVKAILGQLADLPQAAEQDLDERAALQRRMRDLERELAAAKRVAARPVADPAAVEQAVARCQGEAQVAIEGVRRQANAQIEQANRALEKIAKIAAEAAGMDQVPIEVTAFAPSPRVARATSPDPTPAPPRREAAADAHDGLRAGALRMLRTLAQHHPVVMTRSQLGALAGFTPSGGTFGTYLGDLRRLGYIEVASREVSVTPAGLDRAGEVPPTPRTAEERLAVWRRALRAGERRMLDALVAIYPRRMTRAQLAEEAGFEVTGGTFGTYLGVLRRNGLADVDRESVCAAEALFMGGPE